MSLCLCGPSGSGKSTLAREFAKQQGWRFIDSPGGECFRELDLPYTGLSFQDRMRVQWLILERMERQYRDARGSLWISARSPLDALVITLADIPEEGTLEEDAELESYGDNCLRVLNRYCSLCLYVPSGLRYVSDGTRPAYDAERERVQENLYGVMMRDERVIIGTVGFVKGVVDLDVRLEGCGQIWQEHLERTRKQMKGLRVN